MDEKMVAGTAARLVGTMVVALADRLVVVTVG